MRKTINKKEITEKFKTEAQRAREKRNISIVVEYRELCKKNPDEKLTSLIHRCADKFSLTYSATRSILIKVGAYRSKL